MRRHDGRNPVDVDSEAVDRAVGRRRRRSRPEQIAVARNARRGSAGGARRAARSVPPGGVAARRGRIVIRGNGGGARRADWHGDVADLARSPRAVRTAAGAAARTPRGASLGADVTAWTDDSPTAATSMNDSRPTSTARRAGERRAVDAHLSACPPCRRSRDAERAAREVIHQHRDELRCCAPDRLRERCAAHQASAFAPARQPADAVRLPASGLRLPALAAARLWPRRSCSRWRACSSSGSEQRRRRRSPPVWRSIT